MNYYFSICFFNPVEQLWKIKYTEVLEVDESGDLEEKSSQSGRCNIAAALGAQIHSAVRMSIYSQ